MLLIRKRVETSTLGYRFVLGLFCPARIFVLNVITAQPWLVLVTGFPWYSFHWALVSCIWSQRRLHWQHLKYCNMNFQSCEKYVLICFYQRQLWSKCHFARFIFSSLRCISCHESWWQRCIWHFKIFLATPTWSHSNSVRSRVSFTYSSNWVMSSLIRVVQIEHDGRSKSDWFSYFSSSHIIFPTSMDLIIL